MKLSFSVRRHAGPLWVVFALSCAVATLTGRAQRIELAEKDAEPVTVQSADISTEITGRFAITTFDLVFSNPNARVLEGTLLFPLLEGQSVIRFALDINGSLREAVPVDKTHGRIVFEDIERRAADPGLVEKAAGNVYRARIYPIPARGTRHVRISYQEDIAPSADQSIYRLNLDFPQVLKRFHLWLNVHTGASLPAQARTTLDLQLPPWRDGQFMEMERDDFDARGVFEISLPKAERPRVMTGRFHDREYFYAEVPNTPMLFTRPIPKVVGLLWDSSSSGRERNHDRELALLNAWFTDLKNVEVHLVRLRDRAVREGTFTVKDGDWQALRKELESTIYDGATSLDGLTDDPKVDTWVLFSDGLINYGVSDPSPKLPLHGVVHTVLSSTRADSNWLRTVAAYGNGEYVNSLEAEPGKAAFILEAQSKRVLAVEYDPEAISNVFPEPGMPITKDLFVVTGILRKKDAKIRLLVGHNRENAEPVELSLLSGDDPSSLAPRAWALTKIDLLSTDYRANREDIRATSREFGIVTPDTSLIVLENVADYIRYDITPPDELRMEWEARRPSMVPGRKDRDFHMETVVEAFQQRVEWWEKSYPTDMPSKPIGKGPRGGYGAPQPPPAEATQNDEVMAAAPDADVLPATRRRSPALVAAAAVGAKMSDSGGSIGPAAETASPEITLQKWSPQSGYMDHLRRAKADRRYAAYLEDRPEHQREPGFFLDCADFFFENEDTDTALRVLSNLAELELDDPALLRVLAYRLTQANRADLAAPILERVFLLRPEEPQSRRDLALAYAALGKYQHAIDLLWDIVSHPWDSRFPEVELVALEELNAIVSTCGQKLDVSKIDPRLLKNLPLDLRVVLTWDANDCDIDLWVADPNGETAKYDFPVTYQGGHMSRDFTGGYGPEEFMLRRAKAGKYTAQINYYGDRRQTALGPVTAQVRLITGFGTPAQQEKRLTVRLKDKQETLEMGSIEIGPPVAKKAK